MIESVAEMRLRKYAAAQRRMGDMKKQKTALVVGMARSGIGSAKLLAKNGYKVIVNDLKRDIPGLYEALSSIEYTNALGAPPEALLYEADLMVISPVIPMYRPFVKQAVAMGIEVIGEIELGYRYCSRDSKFVCIGGTNGKTTTTMLTGEMFKAANANTFVLGNIGVPITEHAMEVKPGDVIVAETAALQLESIRDFRANAAGLLNITEDHLNHFESMEAYIAAKKRMFENQTAEDYAVLNFDDPIVAGMAGATKGKVIYFSLKNELGEGMFLRQRQIIWRDGGLDTIIINVGDLKIPGEHNVENAMCAAALAISMGVSVDSIRSALKSFTGVEHRIEPVCEKKGVLYINDSKSTNPDSTIKAVKAMTRPTVLLLGVGEYDKHSNFIPLFNEFGGIVKAVIASGRAAPAILAAAEETKFRNISICNGAFSEMVQEAARTASEGDVVLLSPGAASWGAFEDYEDRGRKFKEIVNGL